MSLQIIKKKDERHTIAFTHKIADIPNGITVASADLTQSVLREGTPVGKDSNGMYHIVKTAVLGAAATSTATVYTVAKGHNFVKGEIITLGIGKHASAISSIATNATDSTMDDITVDTTLSLAGAKGDVLVQAASATTSNASAFKYTPVALVGESYDVDTLGSNIVNAWTIGQVKESLVPPTSADIKSALKGIIYL